MATQFFQDITFNCKYFMSYSIYSLNIHWMITKGRKRQSTDAPATASAQASHMADAKFIRIWLCQILRILKKKNYCKRNFTTQLKLKCTQYLLLIAKCLGSFDVFSYIWERRHKYIRSINSMTKFAAYIFIEGTAGLESLLP